jgi:uncharacterized membrane protein YhaH (DUF805 family)
VYGLNVGSWLFGLNGRLNRAQWGLGMVITACVFTLFFLLCLGLATAFIYYTEPEFLRKAADPQWQQSPKGKEVIMGLGSVMIFFLALAVIPLWMTIALAVKRLHDVSLTGWLVPVALVPGPVALVLAVIAVFMAMPEIGAFAGWTKTVFAGAMLCIFCVLCFMPGRADVNSFGAPPDK